MNTSHIRLPAVLLILGLGFGSLPGAAAGAAPATDPTGERGSGAQVQNPGNYCLGGIEDRKIIVDERQLTNPFEQTTHLGCEVDGGETHVMPDLPAPSPVRKLPA